MAVFTALALGAAALAGAGSAISARNQRKDAAKEAKKAEARAKEAAALESTMADTGANVQIGTDDPVNGDRTKRRQARTVLPVGGVSAARVGGL